MTRLIIIIISCLCYIQAFSEEHLKFLGLPIDGTVNEYASKLISKGFYVSPDNKYAGKGLRVMEGPFLGNTEQFGLHYDVDTKRMWSVTFIRSFFKETDAKDLYNKLESLLHEKHNEAKYESPLEGSFVSSCSFQYTKEGDFVQEWNCISDAEKKYSIAHGKISAVCKGKRKSAGGYIWKYKDIK